MITLIDYFGPHREHPAITAEIRSNADALLDKINLILGLAAGDGVELFDNPATACGLDGRGDLGGTGNGGWRPPESKVGAKSSNHKTGHGVDIYDPRRTLARWCLQHPKALIDAGLRGMEDPRWTPTWLHLQDVPPKSGRLVYIPSQEPPLIAALPEQQPTTRTA